MSTVNIIFYYVLLSPEGIYFDGLAYYEVTDTPTPGIHSTTLVTKVEGELN